MAGTSKEVTKKKAPTKKKESATKAPKTAPKKQTPAAEKTTAKTRNVKFQISAPPGSQVYVAGTFNDWKADQKQLKENKDGIYTGTLRLPVGKYEYKFVIDGVWCVDAECEEWASNHFGSINSIVVVK